LSLRSVNDHKTDSDVQIEFGNTQTASANDGSAGKAEKVGYAGGDYAFVMTTEGGIFVQKGAKEDTHEVWKLRSTNWHDDDQNMIRGFGNTQTASADADAKAKAETQSYSPATWGNVWDVQMQDNVPNAENIQLDKWYTTFDEDSNVDDHGYDRATTPRFSADSDDIFMRSMIQQYALEKGDCD
jgi:hypothetical protein